LRATGGNFGGQKIPLFQRGKEGDCERGQLKHKRKRLKEGPQRTCRDRVYPCPLGFSRGITPFDGVLCFFLKGML